MPDAETPARKVPRPTLRHAFAAVLGLVPRAVRDSWIYVTIGIGIAVALSLASGILLKVEAVEWLGPAKFLAELARHLSEGFFVAAVSVFFYEWGGQTKNAIRLSKQIEELAQMQGIPSIEHTLATMFPHAYADGFLRSHADFLRDLVRLDNHENWTVKADIEFLAVFLEEAIKYAKRLIKLREGLMGHGGEGVSFEFNALDFADRILTKHMEILTSGDTYVTLSNPRTFSKLKDTFFAASKQAVQNGAEIRRVFILSPASDLWTPIDARNLVEHYNFAVSQPRYQIQFSKPDVFQLFGVAEADRHYGIFTHNGNGVAFKVKDADVSHFVLEAALPTGPLANTFGKIWEYLEEQGTLGLTEPEDEAIHGSSRFLDAVLTREVTYLAKAASPRLHLVATTESWRAIRSLPDFWGTLIEIARSPVSSVPELRLLFVLGEPEANNFKDKLDSTLMASTERAILAAPNTKIAWCRESQDTTSFPSLFLQFVADEQPVQPYGFSIAKERGLANSVIPKEQPMTADDGQAHKYKASEHLRRFNTCWKLGQPYFPFQGVKS